MPEYGSEKSGQVTAMAANEEKAKRRGRPPSPEREKKRHTLSFRLTDDLKAALSKRASHYGRSLSEEVEYIVSSEVYSNIPKQDPVVLTNDPDFNDACNKQIDIMNSCTALHNIVSKMYADLLDIDRAHGTAGIGSLVEAYMSFHDISIRKLGISMRQAMKTRNELYIDYAYKHFPELANTSAGSADDLKSRFNSESQALHEALFQALLEAGVDIDNP